MKILLTDSIARDRKYHLNESFHLSDAGELTAEMQAHFSVKQAEENVYSLSGSLQAHGVTSCDRCGSRAEFDVRQDFFYQLRVEEEPEMVADYNCGDEDSEVVYLVEAVVESNEILSEQLVLALPAHRYCVAECKGLCDRCGVNLNEESCKCREINENSPFAILKKLQNN